MLEIMLCGASDTDRVRTEFVQVVDGLGANPLHYLSGDILHINSATAAWDRNSRATVRSADLCVFVVVERYGDLTWTTELREALGAGKPFLVLCLGATYRRYLTLTRSIDDLAAVTDPAERSLVAALREVERERSLTIVPFEYGLFGEVLRRQLANLIKQALWIMEARNLRGGLRLLLGDPDRLTASELAAAVEIAEDEYEEKSVRKRAILALSARSAADEQVVLSLLRSDEQGVQRLTIRELGSLYSTRPAEGAFLDEVIAIANSSDDVGLARRLIPALFAFGTREALEALEGLDLSEEGTRRRLAGELEQHRNEIEPNLVPQALILALKCEARTVEVDWKQRLRDLIERWSQLANA